MMWILLHKCGYEKRSLVFFSLCQIKSNSDTIPTSMLWQQEIYAQWRGPTCLTQGCKKNLVWFLENRKCAPNLQPVAATDIFTIQILMVLWRWVVTGPCSPFFLWELEITKVEDASSSLARLAGLPFNLSVFQHKPPLRLRVMKVSIHMLRMG